MARSIMWGKGLVEALHRSDVSNRCNDRVSDPGTAVNPDVAVNSVTPPSFSCRLLAFAPRCLQIPGVRHHPTTAARCLAEGLGTGMLVAAVVGSGIAAETLSPGEVGLQ